MSTFKSIPLQITEAIDHDDLDLLTQLLQENPDQLHFKTPFGKQTWLGYAARKGRLAPVRQLVALGFDINEGDPDENVKPLGQACCTDRVDVVRYLLDSGATIDTETSVQNPLFAAIVARNPDVVKLLLERGINASIRYNSPTMRNMDAVAFALMQGAVECARIIALWNARGDEVAAGKALEEGAKIAKENAYRKR